LTTVNGTSLIETQNDAGDAVNSAGTPTAESSSPSTRLAISSLLPADSPRLDGEDAEHVQQLANIEDSLPPVLVNRSTLRVIDGMHRLRAALLRGDEFIEAHFYDGSDEDAFVEAVKLNVTHGRPLSRVDRSAAAARIIRTHPAWSDRKIASVAGVAAATVAAIRRRSTDQVEQLNTRLGRDGRARPVDVREGRTSAERFLAENPDATLREIAAAASIAPATAKDVRERMARGEDVLTTGQRKRATSAGQSQSAGSRKEGDVRSVEDIQSSIRRLRRDPALRFNEQGRMLLQMLILHANAAKDWESVAAAVPAHCTDQVASVARQCAAAWMELSEQIQRGHGTATNPGRRSRVITEVDS